MGAQLAAGLQAVANLQARDPTAGWAAAQDARRSAQVDLVAANGVGSTWQLPPEAQFPVLSYPVDASGQPVGLGQEILAGGKGVLLILAAVAAVMIFGVLAFK